MSFLFILFVGFCIHREELSLVAMHEAAHTLILLKTGVKGKLVHDFTTIVKTQNYSGLTAYAFNDEAELYRSDYEDLLEIDLASIYGECLYGADGYVTLTQNPTFTDGLSSDVDSATKLAKYMIKKLSYGSYLRTTSDNMEDEFDHDKRLINLEVEL